MDFPFYDPLITKRRSGSDTDPIVMDSENSKIINGIATVSEIPDKNTGISVSASFEYNASGNVTHAVNDIVLYTPASITYTYYCIQENTEGDGHVPAGGAGDTYWKKLTFVENKNSSTPSALDTTNDDYVAEFKPDYLGIRVFFHTGFNGQTVKITFGKSGCHFIPASLVYAKYSNDGNGNYNIEETLQETVDNLTNLESLDVWDNTGVTQYYKNNIVRLSDVTDDYNNSFFICIADVLSSTKPYLDITHWDFLVNMYDINIADHSASQALLWMGV